MGFVFKLCVFIWGLDFEVYLFVFGIEKRTKGGI